MIQNFRTFINISDFFAKDIKSDFKMDRFIWSNFNDEFLE